VPFSKLVRDWAVLSECNGVLIAFAYADYSKEVLVGLRTGRQIWSLWEVSNTQMKSSPLPMSMPFGLGAAMMERQRVDFTLMSSGRESII